MPESGTAHVRSLVLDATPLITQSYSHYQSFAQSFYTTPTVFAEIQDANARKNLEIWQSLGTLKLRHPKQDSIKRVSAFAKLTGDYVVLSANDVHILALAYELETELNNGDWRLRKYPGDSSVPLTSVEAQTEPSQQAKPSQQHVSKSKAVLRSSNDKSASKQKKVEESAAKDQSASKPKEVERPEKDQPSQKKNRRRGGKKQRAKREERERNGVAQEESGRLPEITSQQQPGSETSEVEAEKIPDHQPEEQLDENNGEYDDDDGGWISIDNLTETMIRDSGEDTTGSRGVVATEEERTKALTSPSNQVALATGDFAVQNVALQLNLNLMNFMSGLRIRTLRNYMLRCHACFKMFSMPKDGKPKHFCPACGGEDSLLRCAVSVDASTGQVTPHLKANFQWSHRGNRYSLPSPLSKNSQKRYGKKGYVHSKPQETPILREDQKEYQKMMSQEDWTRRHNEKVLDNWIGGGSADNYMSPFAIEGLKHHSVRVGRGRYVNSSDRRR